MSFSPLYVLANKDFHSITKIQHMYVKRFAFGNSIVLNL